MDRSPNTALHRTPAAAPPSPVSFQTLGGIAQGWIWRRAVPFLLVALGIGTWTLASPDEDPVAAAQVVAKEWLPALDRGEYAKAWDRLAKSTKAGIGKDQFAESMQSMRGSLGAVLERRFVTSLPVKPSSTEPDPKGLDLVYEAAFTERPFALDEVAVVREGDGQWRVGMYRPSFRPGKPMAFSVPGAPWFLELPFAAVQIERQSVKTDGQKGYFQISFEATKLVVSFWIEPVAKCRDSQSCRDMVYDGNTPQLDHPRGLSKGKIGDISVFEYLLPKYKGIEVNQHNLYAEFVANGWWVDMHASKVAYAALDHELFDDLVKTVRFEPKPSKP